MFKVRCKLAAFMQDEEKMPCHFNYRVGDEFYYDGEHFTGRVCPGLLPAMTPVIHGVFLLGHKYSENVLFQYRGIDERDPSMAKYDGLGFHPLKTPPEGLSEMVLKRISSIPRTEKSTKAHFLCGDSRTLANFDCEAVDLSDADYCQPFYRRTIAILEKIEAEPGIKVEEVLDRFTDFERYEISPPLTKVLFEVLMDALTDMKYVEVRDGRAYATGREPPSRPKIG